MLQHLGVLDIGYRQAWDEPFSHMDDYNMEIFPNHHQSPLFHHLAARAPDLGPQGRPHYVTVKQSCIWCSRGLLFSFFGTCMYQLLEIFNITMLSCCAEILIHSVLGIAM